MNSGAAHVVVPSTSIPFKDRRTLLPWYAAEFLNSFAVILAVNGVFFFARYELHCAPATLLWFVVCGGALYTVTALICGRFIARFGQRQLLITTGLANGLIFLIGSAGVYEHSLGLLFLLVAILNISITSGWPALESAITQSPGQMKLSNRITLYNLGWSSSSFLAICITGSVAHWLSWPALFFCSSVASIASAAIIYFLAIPQAIIGGKHVSDDASDPVGDRLIGSPRGAILLNMARFSNLLAYLAVNSMMPVMPFITARAGFSYASATAVGSIWALARIAGFILCWFWTGWHYRVRWMLGGFFALAATTVMLIAWPSIAVLVIGQIIFGLTAALIYAGSLYYSMHLSHGSEEHAGIHEALIGVGTVVGPAVAALAGAPASLVPKAIALGVILVLGGSGLAIMGLRATKSTPISSDGPSPGPVA